MIAKSFACIHWQNLVNFGVIPLTFVDPSDYELLQPEDTIRITGIRDALRHNTELPAHFDGSDRSITLRHTLAPRQIDVLLAGGAINWLRERRR